MIGNTGLRAAKRVQLPEREKTTRVKTFHRQSEAVQSVFFTHKKTKAEMRQV
jgi:hypothetical protein